MTDISYPYRARLPRYIGRAIRETRKSKNMTQAEVADITATSVKFICDVERGKETVQMDKVFDLLRALGLFVYLSQGPLELKDSA